MFHNSFSSFHKISHVELNKVPPLNFSMEAAMEVFDYFDVPLSFVCISFNCLEVDVFSSDK